MYMCEVNFNLKQKSKKIYSVLTVPMAQDFISMFYKQTD